MTQMTPAIWKVNLSGPARKRLEDWQEKVDLGSIVDGVYLPFTQLSIGHLLWFLKDHGLSTYEYVKQWEFSKEKVDLCELLAEEVRNFLEQKN